MQTAESYARMASEQFAGVLPKSVEEQFYRIGGCVVCLRFLGKNLQPIVSPALDHLSIHAASEADFKIDLADADETGIHFPLPDCTGAANETWHSETNDVSLLAQSNPDLLHLVDHLARRGFFWAANAKKLPWYEAGFPLRLIFHLWFRKRRKHLIHAAAIGVGAGAAVIVGQGGSGKSTAALACRDAGLEYLGDDYSLVGGEGVPKVWSLYRSAKTDENCLKRFPQLTNYVSRHGEKEEKSLLMLPVKTETATEARSLRAILWPRVTGRMESRVRPASAAALLLALAPSSILQTPGAGALELAALARITRSVPTFILEAGTDMRRLAGVVENILRDAELQNVATQCCSTKSIPADAVFQP